jgi:DNA-binding NarL/FixJ family response regulator
MRVVIVEDQVLPREGLARLFADGGHDVVTTLGDASTVVDVADRERPDLVVLDFRMPRRTPTRELGPRATSRPVAPMTGCCSCPSTSRPPMPSTWSAGPASATS